MITHEEYQIALSVVEAYQRQLIVQELRQLLIAQIPKSEPMPGVEKKEALTVDELIKYLPWRAAKATIYGMVSRREIPFFKSGKYLLFKTVDIDKWITERGINPHKKYPR